jgi:hypothetical protein
MATTEKKKHLPGRVWAWIKKAFTTVVKDLAPVAVTATELLKSAIDSGAANFLVKILDDLTHSHIPDDVVAVLNKALPKILAVELAITQLPDTPSEDDILAFEAKVMLAWGLYDNKSRLYSTLAAQIYGILQATYQTTPDVPPTWAEWIKAVEAAWQDYLNDKQLADSNPNGNL